MSRIRAGGRRRQQVRAGSGPALVTTTAHRYADRLENGPIPLGSYDRHRRDEPLCTAPLHLERGTPADNRWDTITRLYRSRTRRRHCDLRFRPDELVP